MANPIMRNNNCPAQDELNARIEAIINLYDKGQNPNQVAEMLFGKNPTQLNFVNKQYQTMVKGNDPKSFALDYARQLGVNETNLAGLARILGVK